MSKVIRALFVLCLVLANSQQPLRASSKNGVDDVKLTIDQCGQPSRRTTKPIRDRVGGEEAVLYYAARNTELHYYRNQTKERIWSFIGAFPMNGDDMLSMPELNRKMGCLKGKLQLPF